MAPSQESKIIQIYFRAQGTIPNTREQERDQSLQMLWPQKLKILRIVEMEVYKNVNKWKDNFRRSLEEKEDLPKVMAPKYFDLRQI